MGLNALQGLSWLHAACARALYVCNAQPLCLSDECALQEQVVWKMQGMQRVWAAWGVQGVGRILKAQKVQEVQGWAGLAWV